MFINSDTTNFPMSDSEREEVTNILARHAYSLLLDALRARGRLFPQTEFEDTLENLQNFLNISEDSHLSEVKRVLNDDRLTTLARMNLLNGDFEKAWNNQWSEMLPFQTAESTIRVSTDATFRRLADQLRVFSHRHNENLKEKKKRQFYIKPEPSSSSSSLSVNSKATTDHLASAFSGSITKLATITMSKEEDLSPDIQEISLKRPKILETKIGQPCEVPLSSIQCPKSCVNSTHTTATTTSVLVACGQQLFFVPSAAILVQQPPSVAANASVVSTGSILQLQDSLTTPSLASKLEQNK